jgi:allantoin racemase
MANIIMLIPFADSLGMTQYGKEEFKKFSDLTVMGTDTGLDEVVHYHQLEYHIGLVLEKAAEIEKQGNCDALIVGCFGDPAIDAVRQVTTMPVLGTGEVSLYVAAMLGDKIGVVVPQKQLIHVTERMIHMYRLSDKVVAVETSQENISETIMSQPDEAVLKMADVCKNMIVEKGADVIVFGCLGFTWVVQSIQDIFKRDGIKVPLVDPGPAVYNMAKMFVEMGLNHDRTKLMDFPM